MSKQSFNVDKSLRLNPIDLTHLTNPKNGELAIDINDSNRLKKYNEASSSWETVGIGSTITANKAAVSDGGGVLIASTTTATEIGYISGVTSSVQSQLDAKITFEQSIVNALIFG